MLALIEQRTTTIRAGLHGHEQYIPHILRVSEIFGAGWLFSGATRNLQVPFHHRYEARLMECQESWELNGRKGYLPHMKRVLGPSRRSGIVRGRVPVTVKPSSARADLIPNEKA
jgi:hypothetical protein